MLLRHLLTQKVVNKTPLAQVTMPIQYTFALQFTPQACWRPGSRQYHYRSKDSSRAQLVYANPMLEPLTKAMQDPNSWKTKPCTLQRSQRPREEYHRTLIGTQSELVEYFTRDRTEATFTTSATMPASWQHPSASWKRMYLTQPPSPLIVHSAFGTAFAAAIGYTPPDGYGSSYTAFGLLSEGSMAKERLSISTTQGGGVDQVAFAHLTGSCAWKMMGRGSDLEKLPGEDKGIELNCCGKHKHQRFRIGTGNL